MILSRRLLLDRLELVAPALTDNDLYPVLTYFCFNGEHVLACSYANNDGTDPGLAISAPCNGEFKGCVPGRPLTELLKIARFAVVELLADGDNAVVKLGNAQLTLGMLPASEFPFAMPAMPKANLIAGFADRFFAGVEHCLLSVERHTNVPDRSGVTLIPDGNGLQLLSTNGTTLSRAVLPLPSGGALPTRCILSAPFCKAMLGLAKRTKIVRFTVNTEYAWFAADDTLLFGKLLISEHPIEYQRVLNAHLPEYYTEQLVAIPHRRLGAMLQRARLIADIRSNEPYSEITVLDGVATLRVRSKRGKFEDTMPLPGHRAVAIKLLVSNLCKGFAAFDKILFSERCVALARGNLLRMICAVPLEQAIPRRVRAASLQQETEHDGIVQQ